MLFAVETLSEDEEDDIIGSGTGEGISICAMPSINSTTNFTPTPGGPFSALTPSMWPQDIISRINHPVIQIEFFCNNLYLCFSKFNRWSTKKKNLDAFRDTNVHTLLDKIGNQILGNK